MSIAILETLSCAVRCWKEGAAETMVIGFHSEVGLEIQWQASQGKTTTHTGLSTCSFVLVRKRKAVRGSALSDLGREGDVVYQVGMRSSLCSFSKSRRKWLWGFRLGSGAIGHPGW